MNRFSEEDIIKLHDCLKEISVPSITHEDDEYYINVLKEVTNKLSPEDRLIIYIFMTHDSLLNLISQIDEYNEYSEHIKYNENNYEPIY